MTDRPQQEFKLSARVCHLRGAGAPVDDVHTDEMAPRASGPLPEAAWRVLDALDPAVGADDELVGVVLADAEQCLHPRSTYA